MTATLFHARRVVVWQGHLLARLSALMFVLSNLLYGAGLVGIVPCHVAAMQFHLEVLNIMDFSSDAYCRRPYTFSILCFRARFTSRRCFDVYVAGQNGYVR